MKLDRLCVNAVFQYPPFVVICTQPQLLLLVSGHPPVNHAETSVCCQVFVPFQRGLETLPGDIILSFRHSDRAELLFFSLPCLSM